MDRAAKLAAEAVRQIHLERGSSSPYGRRITRAKLIMKAKDLGIPDLEISAAVDQALTDAGTTP